MVHSKRPPLHLRSVFLSDIHLGARECRAELLLDLEAAAYDGRPIDLAAARSRAATLIEELRASVTTRSFWCPNTTARSEN